MSKFNSLPIIVQQTIESIRNPNTSASVKFNNLLTLENIRDCCDRAIKDYNKKG